MKRTTKRILAFVVTAVMVCLVGIISASPAQATVTNYYKVQDLNVYETALDDSIPKEYNFWVGHIYLRVRWQTDNGPSPDIAHVRGLNSEGPSISISNYTGRDIDVYYMIYSDIEFGVSGQYQQTLFIPGNGGTVYPIISNALWYRNPPSHWLQHRNAPRIGLSAQPHNQPQAPSSPFDPVSMFNIVPNIPA